MLEHFSVTFFTVSKVNGIWGQTDQKICISRRWSYANILISSIAFAGGIIWKSFDSDNKYVFMLSLFIYVGSPHILAALLTIIFLHYDAIFCCCCDCCLGEEQVVIYDPSNTKANLIWRDGQVIDKVLRSILSSCM